MEEDGYIQLEDLPREVRRKNFNNKKERVREVFTNIKEKAEEKIEVVKEKIAPKEQPKLSRKGPSFFDKFRDFATEYTERNYGGK